MPLEPTPSHLPSLLTGSAFTQYLYGYPHKTAYRALPSPRPLREVWADEPKDTLFLYAHVPFCEQRCGFCNLFTAANPVDEVVTRFLDALEREARVTRDALGPARFAQVAVGGGTPTFLSPAQLERLFGVLREVMGAPLGQVPMSVELSPETTTRDRVTVLAQAGADRVSIGVQSLVPAETQALRRPQDPAVVHRALDALRGGGFATLNVDLIYGIEGQTPQSFERSLREVLRYHPEELYLYPLYVRPLTGLEKGGRQWADDRLALYRVGRALLLEAGYRQRSMRLFQRPVRGEGQTTPVYRCQEDGLVGLGCGARSYTRGLHYSHEWAVAPRAVRGLVEAYSTRSAEALAHAHHGFALDAHEQRRRYAILGLLLADGLELERYAERFGTALLDDLPQLRELLPLGLATLNDDRLTLTEAGLERSDVLGPWLHSPQVDALMQGWEAR